jgi:ribosomal protein S18 acetylase RimI-like enzyme
LSLTALYRCLAVMAETLTYRLMHPTDILNVSELIARVYNEFVASEHSSEGIKEFYRYIQPSEFLARQENNHFALISVIQNNIVGIIEVRDYNHISLLFVAPEYQRRGIAKALFHKALQICQTNEPRLFRISVNASLYAVPIYEKLGFRGIGEKQVINGISFVPMVLHLSKLKSAK